MTRSRRPPSSVGSPAVATLALRRQAALPARHSAVPSRNAGGSVCIHRHQRQEPCATQGGIRTGGSWTHALTSTGTGPAGTVHPRAGINTQT